MQYGIQAHWKTNGGGGIELGMQKQTKRQVGPRALEVKVSLRVTGIFVGVVTRLYRPQIERRLVGQFFTKIVLNCDEGSIFALTRKCMCTLHSATCR